MSERLRRVAAGAAGVPVIRPMEYLYLVLLLWAAVEFMTAGIIRNSRRKLRRRTARRDVT